MPQTGPVTQNGKRIVSMNATRHGFNSHHVVLPHLERFEDWEQHRASVLESLQPVGGLECELAERVITSSWRLRRITRYEREQVALEQEQMKDRIADYRAHQATQATDGWEMLRDEHEARLLDDPTEPIWGTGISLPVLPLPPLPEPPRASPAHPDALADEIRVQRALVPLLQALPGLDQSVAVPAGLVSAALSLAAEEVEEALAKARAAKDEHDEDEDDEDTSATTPSLPSADPQGEAWTARGVWQATSVGAGAISMEPRAFVAALQARARRRFIELREEGREMARQLNRRRRARLLPTPQDINTILRYEAHISRELYRALHELEALRNIRRGEAAPLARLEVNGLPPQPVGQ